MTATTACPVCKGLGYRRYVWPSSKPVPCHWFNAGAQPCEKCEGP